jgi:hypothetical protein
MRFPMVHDRAYLLCRTTVDAVFAFVVRTIIEDEAGNLERVEIFGRDLQFIHDPGAAAKWLPRGTILCILTPYLRASGENHELRIDSPSDLVFVDACSPLAGKWKQRLAGILEELKCDGNARLRAGDASGAVACYRHALVVGGRAVEQAKVLSNLAACLLQDGRFLEALDVALRARALDPRFGRAKERMGAALYGLGQFEAAREAYVDAGLEEGIAGCDDRLAEASFTAAYDWSAIHGGMSVMHDVALWVGPFQCREIAGRGRGLVATKDMAVGQVVLIEPAFAILRGIYHVVGISCFPGRIPETGAMKSLLPQAVAQALARNPHMSDSVYGMSRGPSERLDPLPPMGVIDMNLLHELVGFNSFGAEHHLDGERLPPTLAFSGLWLKATLFNHECDSNCEWRPWGNLLVVRTVRAVTAGQELTIGYVPAVMPRDARQATLKANFGFTCECGLCRTQQFR